MSIEMLEAPAIMPASPGDAMTDFLSTQLSLLPAGEHYHIGGVSRAAYDRLLIRRDAVRRGEKITFHAGALELTTVSNPHERWKKMIARLLETLALALRVSLSASGNITLRRDDLDGGFEPDECYYVRHAATMNAVRMLDFNVDPPPDLAIEVEISRSLLDRLEMYRAIGIPELWRFDGTALTFWGLGETGYVLLPESLAFPQLTAADFH